MEHHPLDNLTRGAGIGLAMFGAVFAFSVAQRVDQVTIAVIGGVALGLIVCVPVMIGSMLIVRNMSFRLANLATAKPERYEQLPEWAPAPALQPARRAISVPLVMSRGVPLAQVTLTTQTRAQNGQSVELGANLDTLRALAPIVGVKPPTRSNARDLGIMGNDELTSTLDWLAVHGWCTQGVQGKPRAWTAGATAEQFNAWLEQFT